MYKYILITILGLVIFALFEQTAEAGSLFDVTAGVSSRYDDNISAEYRNERDDIISSISLGISKDLQKRNHLLNLSADIYQNIFWDNSELSNTSESVALSYKSSLSRYTDIYLSEKFSHKYEIEDFGDALGRDEGHYSRYENRFSMGMEKSFTKTFSASAEYTNSIYTVSNDNGTDSVAHLLRLSGIYYFSSASILTVFGETEKRYYDPDGDLLKNSFVASHRYFFNPYLYCDTGVGTDMLDSGSNDFEPHLFFTLTRDLNRNSSLELALRQLHIPQTDTEAVYRKREVSFSFSHRFSALFSIRCEAYFGDGEFTDLGIEDELLGWSINGRYELRENISLDMGYRFREETSNIKTREYSRNIFSFGIKAGF